MLSDDECWGIFLTDAARILRIMNVVANVIQTTRDMAYAFQMKSVRITWLLGAAYALRTQNVMENSIRTTPPDMAASVQMQLSQ